jgi:prophage regulatory protein
MSTQKGIARRKSEAVRHQKNAAADRAAVNLAGDGLLRLPDVLAAVGVAKSTWFAGIAAGRYPKSVRIGRRSVAWSRSAIRSLCERGVSEEAA